MSKEFPALVKEHQRFIERQKIFFVATAARDGRVNLSPKGGPSLVVLEPKKILWLSLTGSGNETAAHLLDIDRITLMWCAFEGPPRILRAYGKARAIHPEDTDWSWCTERIPAPLGARQYYLVDVESVQTSCGYAVPCFEYRQDRDVLDRWAEKKGQTGLEEYWERNNARSIDGRPTRPSERD